MYLQTGRRTTKMGNIGFLRTRIIAAGWVTGDMEFLWATDFTLRLRLPNSLTCHILNKAEQISSCWAVSAWRRRIICTVCVFLNLCVCVRVCAFSTCSIHGKCPKLSLKLTLHLSSFFFSRDVSKPKKTVEQGWCQTHSGSGATYTAQWDAKWAAPVQGLGLCFSPLFWCKEIQVH